MAIKNPKSEIKNENGHRLLILDLDTDPHALAAIRIYAIAAAKTSPQLAEQLNTIANEQVGKDGKG